MRLLRLAPWRRAPLLLMRRPGVALALLAASLVAALPAAAAPMFLSSAQHSTLHRLVDQTCPWLVGLQITSELAPPHSPQALRATGTDAVVGTERLHARAAAIGAQPVAGLSAPVTTLYGEVDATLADRPLAMPGIPGLMLLAREGFADQVEVIERLDEPLDGGLWMSDENALRQGIQLGDELVLTPRWPGWWRPPPTESARPDPGEITLPVVAIYRDLRRVPTTPYWCGVREVFAGPSGAELNPDAVVLPTALLDLDTMIAVGEATSATTVQTIEFALTDAEPTAPAAAALTAGIEQLRTRLLREHPDLFPDHYWITTATYTELGRFARRAELVSTGLLPPVLPITAAGTLVGLAVVAAAAVFWVQRRRRELSVLANHGVGPAALGVKAALEALPAIVVGAAGGWAAAWALVSWAGPSPVLAEGTLPAAGLATTVTAVVGLVLVGGLAAGQVRALTDARPPTHRPSWWRRVPWELTLIAAAPLAWLLLATDRTVDSLAGGAGTVAHVPARLLVVPILAIAGLTILGCRLLASRVRRYGKAHTPAGPARLLAWRSGARVATTSALLVGATAVPVALATYGALATGTIRTTADAQLRLSLGSDTVVTLDEGGWRSAAPPPALAADSTEVLRFNGSRLGGITVDVIAIDPETFTDGAFWDDRMPGATLAEAVAELSTDPTPAVVASRLVAPGAATLSIRREQLPVRVAATRTLPGEQAGYPVVLMHRDVAIALLSEQQLDRSTAQLWIAGDPAEHTGALAGAGLPIARLVSIDDQRHGAVYEPVTYTFQYLTALSVFTGLIGGVGLLLYLESRTAALRRSYVMLRRLGLRPAAHRRALLLELGVPVLLGLVTGGAGALALGYGIRGGLDVNPRRAPGALLELPLEMMAVVGVAALAVAVGAGLLAHARIARARTAEVLREAN